MLIGYANQFPECSSQFYGTVNLEVIFIFEQLFHNGGKETLAFGGVVHILI